MIIKLSCAILVLVLVCSVVSLPVTHPVYANNQYVSAQAIPTIQFRPQAQGYIQPQYVQAAQPQARPVFEGLKPAGLSNYATGGHTQQPQQIQQVLLATNVDRQIQRVAQVGGPHYLQQIQTAQQAAQAQEAFAAAQRKATSQTLGGNIQPIPVPQIPQQQQHQPQYVQPQIRYISRPVPQPQPHPQPQPIQYRQPQQVQYRQPQQVQYRQPQQVNDERQPKEDYDPNPSYQFGFDVKDDQYTNYQNRKEQREGNKITGSYSVVDSDGFVRTVTYTADPKEGFKAEVTRQPTDIVVKIPKPEPQFQKQPQPQYIQAVPVPRAQVQQQKGDQQNLVYQYE